jgi:hypothetical protein
MMDILVAPTYDAPLQNYRDAVDDSELFTDHMASLHLLSALVTADKQMADECFSRALDEYVDDAAGFVEWAKQDGRRAVLQKAIEMIRPMPERAYSWSFSGNAPSPLLGVPRPYAVITSLGAFERFVLVMSAMEGLREEECAALLNCSIRDVTIGRELARRIVAAEDALVV